MTDQIDPNRKSLDLPAHTLKAQLDAAYLALETLGSDRKQWREKASILSSERDAASEQALRFRADYETLFVRANALQSRVEMLKSRVEMLTAEAEQSRQTQAASEVRSQSFYRLIEEMRASRSWRLTRPLRCAGRLARLLKRAPV